MSDSQPGPSAAPRLPYLPGLDALRAVAVTAVLLYHADVGWMPGGFLGVDVFLVISGYLITSLLIVEHDASGRIRLGRFWLRRARRLLPAVYVVIAASLVIGAVFRTDQLAVLRGDALASLAYVMNWHLVLGHQSYFEAFAHPPLLTHLWSLAVEEQFYLVWPLAFVAGTALLTRRRLVVGVALAAVASAALMAALYVPGSDPSRVYYGTDTRAIGLLIGVLLGFAWRPGRLRGRTGRGAPLALDLAGALALGALALAFVRVPEYAPGLYRGGFALVALAAAVLVAVLAHPAARLARVLAAAPLVWLGVRSYGIYLWHWPVIALTRPGLERPLPGPVLVIGQAALTVALAALSYRYVEQPIRRRGAERRLRARIAATSPRLRYGVAGAGAAAAVALAWALATAPPPAPSLAARLAAGASPAASAASPTSLASAPSHADRPTPARTSAGTDAPAPRRGPALAVGDSVMLGAAGGLQRRLGAGLRIDAAIARQPATIVAELAAYRAAGRLPGRVVVQLGNNGPLVGGELARLKTTLAGVPRVVLVTVRVPRRWQDEVNTALRHSLAGWPAAVLADWYAASAGVDGLLVDGVHLTPRGIALYARTIARALDG